MPAVWSFRARALIALVPLVMAGTSLSGCSSCGEEPPAGTEDTGQLFDSGASDGSDTDGSLPHLDAAEDAGGPADVPPGSDATGADATPSDAANPNNPNNDRTDTDCDGLSDAYEFGTLYPGGGRTDPNNPDSDGDGLPDGLEVSVTSSVSGSGCPPLGVIDADPTTRTSPVNADSDGDTIPDGTEDVNHDGAANGDESSATSRDTDGDGLPDNVEDANANGQRDSGETNPARRDSDGDGIGDGVEDANRNGTFDAGETDPRDTDTDGDGIPDGTEDANHDGVRQPSEIDPRTPDTDCDGLSDGEELTLGTSPILADTDGDGVIDGIELRRTMPVAGSTCPAFTGDQDPTSTTDPLDADSDNDGLPDGVEDANGNGAVDTNETDPTNPDTDGDMIPDGDEVLAGSNPLDPMSPNPDVRSGVAAVCLEGALKVVDFDTNAGGNWTLADEQSATYTAVAVTSTRTFVAALDDSANAYSGFIVTMPMMAGPTTAAGQAAALAARFAASAAGETVALAAQQSPRNITTHDGFQAAVSAVTNVNVTTGTRNASALRNSLLRMTTSLAAGAFTGLPTNVGTAGNAFTMNYSLVVRPADGTVTVVLAVLDRTTYNNAANPASIFLNDLTNGTAVARNGVRRSKACDPFVAAGVSVADFIWMADISISTDDDRGRIASAAQLVFNALASNGVDFRMGVVPHTENSIVQSAANAGDMRGVGFTRNAIQFVSYLNDTSGEDGCEFGLSAVSNAITKALPRTLNGAPENARKLRENATLAVVYISDEFAQELTEGQCNYNPGGTACDTGIGDLYSGGGNAVCTVVPNAAQTACINGVLTPYRNQITAQNGIAFAQVVDPNPPGQCNAAQYHCPQPGSQAGNEPGRGYIDIVNATGGTFYSPCVDNPGAALQAIVDAVSGAASQFQLTGNPISSTIKVGLTRQGTGMTTIVPRDKRNGFDYDAVSNSIFFRGAGFRPQENDRVTVSYRIWLPPDEPCGGPCGPNQICDGQLGVCTCDQGQCNAACNSNQTCDANCQCACAPDCNGQCTGNRACNSTSCLCECPADCGGCPTGTVCNQNTCACECDANCGGACNGTNLVCNSAACNCQCPSDCGGRCGAGTTCNTSTCECACPAGCDAACPGSATCDPANNCACECPANCGGNCPDGTTCNQAACACECPATCLSACQNREVCDPNNSCSCVCPADCGGCAPNETCDPANCRCVPIV
ncbi:MAG: hypothetical protein IT384_27605 [Deltaproteobacteria bacterium]|nr:hypothetical protein [Deltaproteobacteria bacterium]